MPDPSFYYAIFKKLQASAGFMYGAGSEHFETTDPAVELAGGFSLKSTGDQNGLFGSLSPNAANYPEYALQPGWQPLTPGNVVPAENPLWALMAASLQPPPVPKTVTVNNQAWPVMPKPDFNGSIAYATDWLGFNTGSHKLIDAFATWIANGKTDDTPKNAPLTFAALATPPAPIPGIPDSGKGLFPILFVASMPHDDGRRHGDGEPQDPGANHVPANFWATSQIFLTDALGNTVNPATLEAGKEFYVAAIIGNNGNWATGRSAYALPQKISVLAEAQAFNTFLSPGALLPSLGNLDTTSNNAVYEPYLLRKQSYDVAGFRFTVDTVFKNLTKAMTNAGLGPAQLGGLTIDAWLKASHACVKVMIAEGEPTNLYPPAGGAPLTFESDPRKDRHIAQKNLMPFDMTVMAAKKIKWANFIVAQAGAGTNALTLQHALPPDAFRVHLAIPRQAYERYIAPKSSKGGAVRGFEAIGDRGREAASKPFPDAVILRQTSPAAEIHVADHAKERFFGMALGLEGDPARLKGVRRPDVSMSHAAHDRSIVGGFTLQLAPGTRTSSS